MNLLRILKAALRPKFKPYLLNENYRIVPAFTVGGKTYFMFDQTAEIPAGRTLAAMAIYNEMDMKCDREYLQKHCAAMDKILNSKQSISIGSIAQLNVHLKERLDLMLLPEFVYKLASVIFFDKSESPYNYDYDYAKKKIDNWKSSGADLDFFMTTPINSLLPYSQSAGGDLKMYLGVAEAVNQIHRQTLTDILSAEK